MTVQPALVVQLVGWLLVPEKLKELEEPEVPEVLTAADLCLHPYPFPYPLAGLGLDLLALRPLAPSALPAPSLAALVG